MFSTTGFGDIVAMSELARIAVSVQMGGTIVLVGLGLRFVNLLVQQRVAEVAAEKKPTIR